MRTNRWGIEQLSQHNTGIKQVSRWKVCITSRRIVDLYRSWKLLQKSECRI